MIVSLCVEDRIMKRKVEGVKYTILPKYTILILIVLRYLRSDSEPNKVFAVIISSE